MRKITCLFAAFVLSLMMIQINDARSQVMIGNGTVVGQKLPINPYYKYSYSQVIYLASEIDASGTINAISWNFKGSSLTNSNNWTIYLGHTTKTSFDGSNDWIPVGELTQVYSGEFTSPTGPGWITIPISDFTYDGTSNLVIAVDENKDGFNGSTDDFYCTAVSGNRGILYFSDQTNPDPASPPSGYLRAYIANVILGGIQQACPSVINLTATDISTNSANLGWTPLGNETLWNIEYGLIGFELGQGTLISGVTTNPYLLTGLSHSTEYEFYVQADCGSGEVSLFAGPKVFKTPCEPYSTFPWDESFEDVAIPALPLCWYKTAISKWVTTNNANATKDADARTGTQFLRIQWSSTNDHIWTPGFSMEAGTSYEFSFWWAGDGYAGWTGDVFMNTSQVSTGAVQIGNSFVTSTTTTDKIYRQFKYNFVPDVSDDYYFAIRVTSTSAPWYLSFDDFTVQYTPSCNLPSDLTVDSITTNSALLGWTPGGSETMWNIEYGFKGFELGQGTPVSGVTTNPYLLTGLSPDTEYEFYVQADCGSGEVSSFAGPKVFKTACVSYSTFPWNESFEDVNVPALPSCWYKYATSKWVTTNNGNSTYDADARTGTQFLRIQYSSNNDHVWIPGFSMEAGTSYEFSFWWAGDGYAGWTGDVVMNTSQDPTGAVQIGNTFITPDVTTDKIYRQFKYNFVPDVSDDYYFAIRITSTSTPWYLSFDDFTLQYTPSCNSPSDLTVGSITPNSALLGWTPGGSETLWNIEYGPKGFDLGQGTLVNSIADNPYLLSGLSPITMYDFYVQADCGGGDLSAWFGPASFTTECETMELPYFQDFTGVAVNTIPVCWTRTHNNWSVQSSSIAGGTSPEIELVWSPSFTDLSLLQSPVFNTVGKTLLLLEFKHYLSHYATPYTLGIKTSSDGITWNTVWEASPSANIAAETKEIIINNSDVGSPTFQFAFFFDGYIFNINYWNIDDVKLFAPEYGTLSGYVTEATRGVIVGAHVFSGSYEALTDATGYYEIADMLVDVYDVTCEADGYVSVTEVGVEISANQVTELDFQLGIPSIFVDPESISANTEPGGLATETLTISNPEGTAPLTWSARVKILSDRQSSLPILTQQQPKVIGADEVNPNPSGVKPDCTDEMFDLLASFPVNDVGGTYSIVCDGNFLYTGRWNANGYDKYSLEGDFIEHFEIPGAGKTRDLTYDGQYFYGSPNSATIYQMDFENKTLVSAITTTGNIIRAISYDSDNDAFWVTSSNFNGPFKLISRTGETLQTLATTVTGISGIAYDNVSEDGPFLWAYTPASAGQHKLVKVDLTTGEAILTFDLMTYGIFGAEKVSGGLEITDAVVEGKWTFIGCSQNDILFVVELTDSTPLWVTIAPKQGVVDPGSSDQIDVSFNATDLEEGIYFAYINITHNGQEVDNGVITVPVELSVGALAPPQPATLVSPANNATFVPLQPEFTWIANSPAFNRLIITTGAPPFTTTVYTSPWFIGDSFDLASTGLTLEKKKNYNWQVNTKNSAGSVNSPIWKFQTLGAGIFKGLITDSYSGLPLEGVEVTTDPGDYVVLTDNTGNYTIEDVLEGDYTLTANKDGYNTATENGSITHNATAYVNFELNMFLAPPFGLHAEIENINDVHLTWVEPGTGFEPTWLYYTTIIDNAIGTNSAAEFDVAMRFTPDMLTGFAGGSVTKVKFAPYEPLSVCSYTIKIWQGENPPNLIYSQSVPEIVVEDWNEVILNTPVPFDNTMELWIGYGVNTTAGWPAGCDAGPMVDGFGNMMYFGGQWQTLYQLNDELTFNWSIQAFVEAAKGPITLAPVFEAPVTSTFGGALTLSPNGLSEPVISVPTATRSPRAFLGYNVYRDNILLALVSDTEYYDLDLAVGTYSYEVTAVYDQGESEPAGPVSVTIIDYGALTVTPGSLDETHSHPSQVTTKTLTVSNTGNGPIEFNTAVDYFGKGNRASGLCIDNLYSTGCFAFDDGLVSWQLANVYQDIPCVDASDWYHDYTNIVHELEPGETYQVTVETTYTDTYLAIWIDFNDDLLLTSDELLANFYCETEGFHTFDITIPADASSGSHVLRFRTNWDDPATDPCATYYYGNAADFMATVSTPWISIEPSAGILNVGESMDVIVTFTSAKIDYGVHNADILFTSNNPFATQPEVTVSAQLTLLDLRGTFYGQVLDVLGNPLEGVTITADEYRALSTMTDEQGEYVLKVHPGEYTLTASKVGYISETSMPITIATGDLILQDFELEYAAPVMISAEADFFGVGLEWEGNPAIDMKGRFADISLSNMAEKPNASIQEEILLHGPTSVIPKAIASRAVGDDCNDPIIVGELPYTDVNTTCGRGNTYSETCLGSYDGGEDIIYKLTLTEAKSVTINLTTTATWTGMLITQECPIGVNCVDYVTGSSGNKTLMVDLTPGIYFIMMDTWPSPACINEFTLEITAEDPCSVECPAGAIPESELCGEDLNGGCNSAPEAFESIAIGDVICGTAWADNGSRDTDWYELIITEPQILTWTVTAEFPVYAFIIDGNNGCDGLEIISVGLADPCVPAVATATVIPGTYWLWVGNQTFDGNPCGAFNNYVAELTAEETFITYYNLYRDDEMINTLYKTYYYDEDVEQGETYCYSVEQVLFPEVVSGMSNILFAEVPIQPIISVNPEALIEFLEVGVIAGQILSVHNSSVGDLNFAASIIFGKNAVKVSGSDITYPQSLGTQEAADVATEVGSNNIGGYSVPIAGTKDLLFNNGPFETGQCATTLAPESAIGQPANTYGFNMNKGFGYSVAEDFTVPAGMMWGIESFEFFGYQTESSTTSTFTGVFVRIWDGNPMEEGSSVIWGDNATNLMTLTEFTGIYRVSATCETTRPIMRIVAGTSGLELNEGTYWVEFSTTGSLTSGPWVVLVSLPGSTPVGNALQYTGSWSQLESPTGSGNYVGLPFLVNGTSGIPWLTIDPELGSVSGVSQFDINVTFDATNLEDGIYYASILINSNDPVTPQFNVPVTLFVGEHPSQDILIPLGWSGWSAYINPMGTSFENVVASVVNDMVITQHFTEMFWPQYGINTMGNFTSDHGYISKMSASATLSIEGMMAVPTIILNAGWNLFPILVDCNLDAAEVFGGITGFIIGYEVAGNGIYYPAGSIATLTTLVSGKAYWVKVSGAATYTFPECVKGAKASYIAPLRHTNTTPWNEPTYTSSSHIVVFNADASVSFAKGDMIGAFTNDGACAGLTLCDGKAVSLALFADDITTSVKDGFVQGESLTFKLHRQSNDTEYNLVVSYSSQAPNYDGLFEANGLSVINNVTMYATGIGSQDLTSLTVYPNPSQGLFNVSVDNHSQDVNWVVTDAKGRYVMEGRLADSHQIDLRTQPKGVYFIKFTGDNVLRVEKLIVR